MHHGTISTIPSPLFTCVLLVSCNSHLGCNLHSGAQCNTFILGSMYVYICGYILLLATNLEQLQQLPDTFAVSDIPLLFSTLQLYVLPIATNGAIFW